MENEPSPPMPDALALPDVAELRAKVDRGELLTPEEVKALERATAGEAPVPPPAAAPVKPSSQVELARALGCDRRTVTRFLKMEGNPGRDADGNFNLSAWQEWARVHGRLRRKQLDRADLEVQTILLRNERLEIENAERRGELMNVDEVCKVLTDMMGGFVAGMRGLKHNLSPQVVGVSVGEASKRIGVGVDEMLTRLALGEWAKKKAFWSTVYARLRALHKSYNLGGGESDTSSSPSPRLANDGPLLTPSSCAT